MASIFTYEPDPPTVSSPWPTLLVTEAIRRTGKVRSSLVLGNLPSPVPTLLEDYGVEKLEAEPQSGPVEYKLHLLLRPRRSYLNASPQTSPKADIPTGNTNGSGRSAEGNEPPGLQYESGIPSPLTPIPTARARRERLQNLTTQLLWRLQQSSPYHSSSTTDLVLPSLPDANPNPGVPIRLGILLPGLEETEGALYEIGAADDGTLFGLTRDELDESVVNLRAMAASLGCKVEIVRVVVVGSQSSQPSSASSRASKVSAGNGLLVAEVFVTPDTTIHRSQRDSPSAVNGSVKPDSGLHTSHLPRSQTEQLRVSLTGSTTSGKSSLLGTLSTSTLDNSRGKSRLSMLKHQHEIASGVTSSVTFELIGYETRAGGARGTTATANVINHACDNIEAWTGMHEKADGGRLVVLIDSAGHPRYRRTIVRGLVAWSPHWTICCISATCANQLDVSPALGGVTPGSLGRGTDDASQQLAHLELCLKMDLSIVVTMTKIDAASNQGLRTMLGQALSIIKGSGRLPLLLPPTKAVEAETDLQVTLSSEEAEVLDKINTMGGSTKRYVPIVLTSAVSGSGITKLHSLLRRLPFPPSPTSIEFTKEPGTSAPTNVFHVDEVFAKDYNANGTSSSHKGKPLFILSGLVRHGHVSIGDELLLGPFPADHEANYAPIQRPSLVPPSSLDDYRPASYPVTQHELAMRRHAGFRERKRDSGEFSEAISEGIRETQSQPAGSSFHAVRVVSIRNLRLPVQAIFADQAGTIGIDSASTTFSSCKPRKGMILASTAAHGSQPDNGLVARSGFTARFNATDYDAMEPGSLFNIYVASIRALAKIATVGLVEGDGMKVVDGTDDIFELESALDDLHVRGRKDSSSRVKAGAGDQKKKIEVVFQLVNSREWIEGGSQVLVMPAVSVDGRAGLEGYVGTICRLLT